eukprot:3423185-Rhodomonas_salina.2
MANKAKIRQQKRTGERKGEQTTREKQGKLERRGGQRRTGEDAPAARKEGGAKEGAARAGAAEEKALGAVT